MKKRLIFCGVFTMVIALIVAVSVALTQDIDINNNHVEDWDKEWDALYPFEQDGLWGYRDVDGEVVIEPQFEVARNFSEGLAFVRIDSEHRGYINLLGNFAIILPPTSLFPHDFSEGFARIVPRAWDRGNEEVNIVGGPGGPFIFIDRTGKNIFEQEFTYARDFEGGLAQVTLLNGNTAFIDRTGQNAFDQEFRHTRGFIDGLALVPLLNGNWIFIDRTGTNVFGMEFSDALEFRGNYAPVVLLDGRAVHIDREGNVIDRSW